MAARSTHVILENRAGPFNLRRTDMGLDHGEWTDPPPQLIGNKAEWQSESSGVMTGTEGRVTYQIEDIDGKRLGELSLHWDNPFVGSNSYDESVVPAATHTDLNGFSVLHLGGDGNDATVRFQLHNGYCVAEGDSPFCVRQDAAALTRAAESQRYAAIWEQTSVPLWYALHGMTSAEYQQKFDELTGRGLRLTDVSGYAIGGEDRYAAIFEQQQGPPWTARHGLTSEQYQQTFNELTGQGYRLTQVSGYAIG